MNYCGGKSDPRNSLGLLKDGHLAIMAKKRWLGTTEVASGKRLVKGGGITS